MLKVLDLTPTTSPAECAAAISACFPDNKVIHLRGLGHTDNLRSFFEDVFGRIGQLKALGEDARIPDREKQRTGEIWLEVRYDSSIPDAYRHSANAQPLHTDGSYVADFPNAGFLGCVSMSEDGGETVFLDGVTLVQVMERRQPALLSRVLGTVVPHRRSGDARSFPVIRLEASGPKLNWNYYCVDPEASEEVKALREDLFAFLRDDAEIQSSLIDVKLSPGDAVLWKDDYVLHGRKSFQPSRESERFLWKACVDVFA